MAQPLKICTECLAHLRKSGESQQDLAAYLLGTGAGGIDIVPAESCQAHLTEHTPAAQAPVPAARSLADVTPEELEAAIASLLKQLKLSRRHPGEAWDVENAIKAEWLKALEIRRLEGPD